MTSEGLDALPSPYESEARLLLDSVRRLLADQESRSSFRRNRHDLSSASKASIWQGLVELGIAHASYPSALGGADLPIFASILIAETVGRELGPDAYIPCAIHAAAFLCKIEMSTERAQLVWQQTRSPLIAVAIEKGATPATLRREANRIVLSGSCRFVRGVLHANHFVVIAHENGHRCALALPRDTPGLTIVPEPMVDGTFSGRLTFEDVEVPEHAILAAGDACNAAIEHADIWTTVAISAELLGIHAALLGMTLDYLRLRSQFDRRLGEFQALQHRVVDCFIQKEMSRFVVHEAALTIDAGATGKEARLAASRAKARSAEAVQRMSREAIQIHGAMGFSDEGDVGLFVKRALVLTPWFGNADAHRRRFMQLCDVYPAEAH